MFVILTKLGLCTFRTARGISYMAAASECLIVTFMFHDLKYPYFIVFQEHRAVPSLKAVMRVGYR